MVLNPVPLSPAPAARPQQRADPGCQQPVGRAEEEEEEKAAARGPARRQLADKGGAASGAARRPLLLLPLLLLPPPAAAGPGRSHKMAVGRRESALPS